ncbi:DUF2332 family protein [Rhodobacteraceae bacterium]|nr:DUF2332 family protein [Paracoccaceae bacterium]
MTVRDAFHGQSRSCAGMGSPFMGRLMTLCANRLAPGSAVADRVLNWPGDPSTNADSVPLRLAGGLHALKLDGLALGDVYPPETASDDALWQSILDTFETHRDRLLDWLTRPPQTNEVRRSGPLLVSLAQVAKNHPDCDIELLELGASGGLNLFMDRYRLDLPGLSLGPPNAPLILTPDWTGPLPHHTLPRITARSGVDLAPLDPTHSADRLRFLAYLWPDQPERLRLTELALTEARVTPVVLSAGDAGAWLEHALAEPTQNLRVVFHSVAWQYFPEATKARARNALQNTADLTLQIAMEADDNTPGAALTLTEWPNGTTTRLGRADFHGRWIDWY